MGWMGVGEGIEQKSEKTLPIFINKVLLGHTSVYLHINYGCFCSIVVVTEMSWPVKPVVFLSALLQKMFVDPCHNVLLTLIPW